MRRPWRERPEIREQSHCEKCQQHDHDSHGSPAEVLLSGSGIKGKQNQSRYAEYRRYQQKECFHVGWQQREDRVYRKK